MKALYKGELVNVWEVSKSEQQPEWIVDLFNNHYLTWYDDQLKILASAINLSSVRNIKQGLLDSLEGNYAGGYKMASIGEFFDATNGRVVSKKKFTTQYTVINE